MQCQAEDHVCTVLCGPRALPSSKFEFFHDIFSRLIKKSLERWFEKVVSKLNNVRKTKPNNIPSNPEKTYKHNWKGWKDFLKIGGHNLHKTP